MSRGALILSALLTISAGATLYTFATPPAGGPGPLAAPGTDLRTLDCAGCHAGHDAQWRASGHARAWSGPVFQAEYARNPAPSCRGCHAPATAAAPGRGIDCATCHVHNNEILATRVTPPGELAHPLRAAPGLAGVDACANCHQFAFVDDGVHDPRESLQDTVNEWQRSRFGPRAPAAQTCQRCHMPYTQSADLPRTNHGLRGPGDAALLAGAVTVTGRARRMGDDIAVEVELRGARIGHAFPTGDVFREAALEVHTDAGARDSLVLKRWLARTLDEDGEDHHLRVVDDTRVPPPGDGVWREQLSLADRAATRVYWRLRLHRLPPAVARARGLLEHVDGIAVAEGVFTVEQ